MSARRLYLFRSERMKTPQVQVDTDTVVLAAGYREARAATAALVERLERSLSDRALELPSLPEVVLKIRQALGDEDVSVSEVVRLLGADPALAARILKVSNSALFFRGGQPITSLHKAVSQLGYKMVRNVAMSFAAQQVFIGYGNRELREHIGAIWRHSIRAATLAHMLARVRSSLEPDEAFLAGLLHEVGKLYILVSTKDDASVLADAAGFQSVLTAWHPRIGRAVIEAWQLSPALAAAVGDHESCGLEALAPPTLTSVLAAANFLAEESDAACADQEYHSRLPDLGALHPDKPTFDWLVRAADVDVRLLMLAFGL